eukprot:Rmarinus@m.11612
MKKLWRAWGERVWWNQSPSAADQIYVGASMCQQMDMRRKGNTTSFSVSSYRGGAQSATGRTRRRSRFPSRKTRSASLATSTWCMPWTGAICPWRVGPTSRKIRTEARAVVQTMPKQLGREGFCLPEVERAKAIFPFSFSPMTLACALLRTPVV